MADLNQLVLPVKNESTGEITNQTFDIGGAEYTAGNAINITNNVIASTVFTGTNAQWEALTSAEKAFYTIVNIVDDADYVGNIVDEVIDGNISAVTSNAVYDALLDKADADDVGDISDLQTTDKSSVVAAIDEVDAHADAVANTIGDWDGTFSGPDVTSVVSDLSDAIGDLDSLDTEAKNNLVDAINEVNANKVNEPASEGIAGQVLTTDGNGGRSWTTVGGGTDIPIGDVTGASGTQSADSVVLTWSDPEDVVISGVTFATWAGTTVVRKVGSAPADVNDGTVVVTNTTRNQYSSTGYTDSGLTYGQTYYYRFFPYKMNGAIKSYTSGSSVHVLIARTVISTIPSQSGTLTYSGTSQSPTWSNYDSNQLTISGDTSGTNAGTYTATFTPKNGYEWSDGTVTEKEVTWTIQKASLTPPTVSGTSFTYNGSAQGPTIAAYDSTKISVSGATATDAGSYTVTISLVDDDNYQWVTGAVTSVNWSIAKAAGGATFTHGGAAFNPSTDTITLDSETLTDTLAIASSTGTISSVTSSDTSTVTASLSGSTITFSNVNETTGTVTVIVSVGASTNYEAANVEIAVEAKFTQIYGAEWDGSSTTAWSRTDAAEGFTNPSPAVSNGNGSSPFDNILPWSGLKRVTDADAGTLVEIPKYYYKWTRNGSKMKLQISSADFDGAFVSPAHADRGDGIGERDVVYVGAYHCATSTYKSTTGVKPMGNVTRANFRTGIHNLGTKIWQYDYAMYWTIMMLYLVEYADWNTQAKIGYGCGNNSSTENMGLTDSMTYHTGTNAASRTTYGHTRYRYIEDLWGNVYDWCDGIYFSSANVYCIKNPSSFSDTSGGTLVGTRATTSGYISAWTNSSASGFEYALYPNAASGSDSTYCPDYCNYNASGVVLFVGGSYGQGQDRGGFYLDGYNAASDAYASVGSRLQKLP